MLRARDTASDISMKSVGKQTSELFVLPRVGVGAEGVVNSPGKKVTVDMNLKGQEGICPRDEIRGGRKWHFKWRDWLGQRSCALNNIWYLWEIRASLIAQLVKNLPAMQETLVQFQGQEDPLEKG